MQAAPQLIPFWILDFGFWIGKLLTGELFSNPFVAIIFQIGITSTTLSTSRSARGSDLYQ